MFTNSDSELGTLGKSFFKKAARAVSKPVVKTTKKVTNVIPKPIRRVAKVVAAPTGIPYLQRKLIKKPQMAARAAENAAATEQVDTGTTGTSRSAWMFGQRIGRAMQMARQTPAMAKAAQERAQSVPATSPQPPSDMAPPSAVGPGPSINAMTTQPQGGGDSGGSGGIMPAQDQPDEQQPDEQQPQKVTEESMLGGMSTPVIIIVLGAAAYLMFGKKKGRR